VVESARYRALEQAGLLHPTPAAVVAEPFRSDPRFFACFDKVQVKYEMLRAHVVDGLNVTDAAAIHGYSRPAYYLVADSFAEAGMMGLLDERRGRRGPLKLSAEILAFIRSADPDWSSAILAQAIMRRFAVALHRRTVERARQR
jgi:transposase